MADDDDWVGIPPEGRYTRDRARPEFWWRQRAVQLAFVGLVVAVALLVLVLLLG